MRILDIDLDFFLDNIAHDNSSGGERLSEEDFKPWSEEAVREFLESRCGLSTGKRIPGKYIIHHHDAFYWWRELSARKAVGTRNIEPGPPGRPGRSPTQAPHRSVLAPLTHTAPHLIPSLPWRSVVVSLARAPASMDRPCCPPTVHEMLSPSLPRVPRVSSPGSTVLWDAPTPGRSSRRVSLPSLGDTTLAPDSLPPAGTHSRGHGELVFRFPSRRCRWKRPGLSGSRATLMSLRPALGPR
jgi:hypothetical protein